MCCCGRATKNGEPGAYSWDGKTFMTYQPVPPEMAEGDELLADEPGRCGKIDCHSHHFRIVKNHGMHYLLVRHGGGAERIELGFSRPGVGPILAMNSDDRYWVLFTLYSVQREQATTTRENERTKWARAAYEKRIRVSRRGKRHKVWIEEPATVLA